MTPPDPPTTANDAGIPASSDEHSLTVGPDGPILLQDHYVVQKMAQFNRGRIPERVVHAKGGGAHGFFEVTEDATAVVLADFLSAAGKRTPAFVRFSTVAGELGSADTVRDPRQLRDQALHRARATTTSSATTRPCSSSRTRASSRTSSTPRSGCPRPTAAPTRRSGTSGPCRPSRPTRSRS